MYPTRIVSRPQTGHRVVKSAGPACARNMSSSFFPSPFVGGSRHGGFNPFAVANNNFGDFQPFLRVLDETSRALESLPFGGNSARRQARSEHQVWQPRFDVREVDDAYELRGELPGVENSNLEVEFTDANTLVIRGRTESERTENTAPQAVAASTTETSATPAADNDAASVHSNDSTSSYVKPTVEDEESTANAKADTTTTVAAAAPDPAEQAPENEIEPNHPDQSTSHYWLNERSTGTFQRSFAFSTRVDHDGVTASLRNGILNVTVPKAPEPAARKIAVQ